MNDRLIVKDTFLLKMKSAMWVFAMWKYIASHFRIQINRYNKNRCTHFLQPGQFFLVYTRCMRHDTWLTWWCFYCRSWSSLSHWSPQWGRLCVTLWRRSERLQPKPSSSSMQPLVTRHWTTSCRPCSNSWWGSEDTNTQQTVYVRLAMSNE